MKSRPLVSAVFFITFAYGSACPNSTEPTSKTNKTHLYTRHQMDADLVPDPFQRYSVHSAHIDAISAIRYAVNVRKHILYTKNIDFWALRFILNCAFLYKNKVQKRSQCLLRWTASLVVMPCASSPLAFQEATCMSFQQENFISQPFSHQSSCHVGQTQTEPPRKKLSGANLL